MRNKQEIFNFIKNLNLLLEITNHFNNKKNNLYYIIYSPYIYNKIEWCKETKELFLEILFKKLNITKIEYSKIMSLSTIDNVLELWYFIKLHYFFPEYKKDFRLWINLLYFSNINLQSIYQTWKTHKIFLNNKNLINVNSLNVSNIIIALDLLFYQWKKILLESIDIQNNNLLLMLISDYKDILLNIRKKDYIFELKEVDENMKYIENISWISRETLFKLDYQILIEKNYKKYNSHKK